jgi:glyoxylase-like metal-dependent hydrolase (beta-lactamase superfamily II)
LENYKIHEINGYIQTIYLIEEDNSFFLLDGCCRPDVEIVRQLLENHLNKNMDDLKLVIATHAHPDHSGGLKYFKAKGVKIAGPKHLHYWYDGFSGFFTYWVDILLTYLVAINKKSGFKNILFPRRVELDFILNQGDSVPGFEGWKVLECPGHTNVDLSIYHPKDKICYVADNFVGSKKGVFRPYPLFAPDKYKESLQKYIDLEIKEFMLAHYGRVKIPEERIQKLIETTPKNPRKHTNTLPAIFLKLAKAILRKL